MGTISEQASELTLGSVSDHWASLCEHLGEISPVLLGAVYVVLYAGLLGGAALAAVYLSTAVGGMAGTIVFLTGGLGLVAAVPVAARRLIVRIDTARQGR